MNDHIFEFLGKSYNEDKTPIPKALYESCKLLYINDNGDGSYSFWYYNYLNFNVFVLLKI